MKSPKEISNAKSSHIETIISETMREANYTDHTAKEIIIENKDENTNVHDKQHHKDERYTRGTNS
ncbi:hypothetical protein KY289_019970 [Solanum tuberosum]|nr:hypothetical protein KY289_019970 [Solanum tuberosum]